MYRGLRPENGHAFSPDSKYLITWPAFGEASVFDLATINNELLHLDDYIKEWNKSEE